MYEVLAQLMEHMLYPPPTHRSPTCIGRNPKRAEPWPDESRRGINHAISFSVVIGSQLADQQAAARCRLLARNGQAMSAIWSLTGGKRTSRRQPNSVAIDPSRK